MKPLTNLFKQTCKITIMVVWLIHQTNNLRITSHMGSKPVKGKPLFPQARNFTLIAQYWLVLGMV